MEGVLSIADGFVIIVFLVGTYLAGSVVYNLFFHPLKNFPGPLLAKSSLLWRIWKTVGGRFHAAVDEQHRRYGSVFRVSPNELSFASATSWKSIYGHPGAGKPTLVKSEFYNMYGSGFDSLCIGSERDPKTHGRMKRSLAPAFSAKALSDQEQIVHETIDVFIEKLGKIGGPNSSGLNMTKWYEMIAFDVLGEMVGESFRSVEDGKPHFWQELILDHLFFITIADNLRRFPFVPTIARWLFPFTVSVRDKHSGYTRDKVSRRLAEKNTRKDLLTNLVDKVESGEIQREEMSAHVSTLIIAGGETVGTFLGAVTYHLLKTPAAYQKLQAEIRGRYSSATEIDAASAQQLPYLQAVIQEGLRIYPPGSQGFPRVSPGVVIDGQWIPKGTEVYTSAWTVTHDPQYFHDPMSFKPERWLDPNCKDLKEASQPFSLGPRGCLGKGFALVETSLILSRLFHRYNLELVNKDLDWEGQSKMHVMWWKPALYVRFTELEQK